MATSFKSIQNKDITTTRTLLHETIPVTGSIVSGTYGVTNTATEFPNEGNIKNYSHGMFQSVFDYPFLSSSANHLFDLTVGYSSAAKWATGQTIPSSTNTHNTEKLNIYNQMAQVLVGHDHTGSIKEFKIPGGDTIREAYFINFSRLLTKDEIKKGSLTMSFGTGSGFTTAHNYGGSPRTLHDYGDTTYYTDSPAGDYAVLTMSANPPAPELGGKPAGLIYYQAGIAVLSASMFYPYDPTNLENGTGATAIDCIDITGVDNSNADASFTISIPTAAGGLGGTAVTFLLDYDQNTGAGIAGGANQIGIGAFGATDAAIAANVIKAINGVATDYVEYASSGNGESGDNLGITAKEGSSDTQITLTMKVPGTAGNITSALASATGHNVIDVTAFTGGVDGPGHDNDNYLAMTGSGTGLTKDDDNLSFKQLLVSSSITGTTNALRHRIDNIEFQNTTELNSTIHFCRMNHNEFNYSSNPTYVSASKIQVKDTNSDSPITYATTIGLYGPDNVLLAVAKLSEPLKKDPSNEITLRVRLDY